MPLLETASLFFFPKRDCQINQPNSANKALVLSKISPVASSISSCKVSRAAPGSPISTYIFANSYLASKGAVIPTDSEIKPESNADLLTSSSTVRFSHSMVSSTPLPWESANPKSSSLSWKVMPSSCLISKGSSATASSAEVSTEANSKASSPFNFSDDVCSDVVNSGSGSIGWDSVFPRRSPILLLLLQSL